MGNGKICMAKIMYDLIIGLCNRMAKYTRKERIILFNSFPDFSDNAISLYNYIKENRNDITEKYKLIWAVKQKPTNPDDFLGMDIILKNSIKGFWLMLHSRYIVITHNVHYGYVSANGQTILNLWHGCGFKGMNDDDLKYNNGDYNIVTSEAFISSHSKAFKIPADHVLVTGLPRNDVLYKHDKNVLDKLHIDRKEYKKIIIWMPTYRKAKFGHDALDGDEFTFGAYSMSRVQFEQINSILSSERYLLIIKPHPMDSATTDKTEKLSNIRCITNEELSHADILLYSLLAETDALMSDYSSVIVDYLLLDKPITLVMSDVDSYKNTRGFTFDNMEDYIPGPTISDFKGLCSYFEEMDGIDKLYETKRRGISKMLHQFHDGNSCKRVCDAIWGEV